jgi:hypothetical protein
MSLLITEGLGFDSLLITEGLGVGGLQLPVTDLVPTLDRALVLRPLLSTALEHPGAPGAQALQPGLQALRAVGEAALEALGLSPEASTEPAGRPAARAQELRPQIDTEDSAGIDLSAKQLAPDVAVEPDPDPAAAPRNLRPKLKR